MVKSTTRSSMESSRIPPRKTVLKYFKERKFNRKQIEARLMKRELNELIELYKEHCGKGHRLIPKNMPLSDVIERDKKHGVIKRAIVKDLVLCLVSDNLQNEQRLALAFSTIGQDTRYDMDVLRTIMEKGTMKKGSKKKGSKKKGSKKTGSKKKGSKKKGSKKWSRRRRK